MIDLIHFLVNEFSLTVIVINFYPLKLEVGFSISIIVVKKKICLFIPKLLNLVFFH